MGVLRGPLRATRVLLMDSKRSGGRGVPICFRAESPARMRSHLGRNPAASRIFTTASVISAPMPSPGISVTTLPSGFASSLRLTKGFLELYLNTDNALRVDCLEMSNHPLQGIANNSLGETLAPIE